MWDFVQDMKGPKYIKPDKCPLTKSIFMMYALTQVSVYSRSYIPGLL